jgi:hypothetical protein
MQTNDYLMPGSLLLLLLGGWSLAHASRNAREGYQDEFGFHFGQTPPVTSLYDSFGNGGFYGQLGRAPLTQVTKRSRNGGSKPPMLPANLTVDDLNPQPAAKSRRARKVTSRGDLKSGQTQIPFPNPDQPAEQE